MKKPDKHYFGFKDDVLTAKWETLGGKEAYENACKEYEKVSERTLVNYKKYTFTLEEYDNHTFSLIRHNDGFNIDELLNILSIIGKELIAQKKGKTIFDDNNPITIKH